MKALKIFMMFFMGLMVLSSASAELVVNKYVSDFTLSSPNNEQLKLCSCETKVDTLIVENVGNFDSQYVAKVNSNYPGKIRLEEKNFGLQPKHFRELVVYIEDSCGLVGTWDYTVEITSNYGRVERLSRTINSQVCQTSLLNVQPSTQEVGLCEPASFTVTVENVGTYADTFRLDFGPYNDIAEFEYGEFYLIPDQVYSQEVNFTRACEFYGEYTVPFILTTESGTPGAYQEGQVTVRNEYEFAIDLETEAEVCALSETHMPLIVENNAPVEDEFTLVLEGPGFMSIDGVQTKELTISGNNAQQISLIATPGKQDIGEHEITIKAYDKFGGLSKTRTMDIDVSNCFDPSVQLMKNEVEPALEPVVTCCGPKTYYVNVKNDGDREQVFQLRIDGPSFFTLDETTVRVQPSQNINVPIRANLPCSDETYEFSVIVSPLQNDLEVSGSMTIESQTQRTCHMVQIDDDELAVRETDTVLPVLVKHTGIEGGLYSIEMDSTLFKVQEDSLELTPGEQTVIHFEPLVNLTEQEKGRYILQPKFTLQELNIDYNEHVGLQIKGKTLWQAFTSWLTGLPWCAPGACGWFAVVLFVLLAVLFILLLAAWLAGFTFFKGGLPASTLTALKTLLVILIAVVLLVLLFIPGPSASEEYERMADGQNHTVLEWYQNQELTVDLDQYFNDPDMDVLSYSASQPRDVSIDIEGSQMTLTPDPNWAGENTMIITAEDGKGGQADSPIFLLRVIAKQPVSFWGWIQLWCPQIILAELLLILMVLLLMLLTVKEERPDEDPEGNVIVVVPGGSRKKSPRKKSGKKASAKKSSAKSTVGKAGRNRLRLYASKTGTKAHKHDCMSLDNVRKKDLVEYKSETAVLKAGLALCSICHDVDSRNPTKRMKKHDSDTKASSSGSASKKKAGKKKSSKKSSKSVGKKSSKKTRKKPGKKSKATSRKSAKKKTTKKASTRKSSKKTVQKRSKKRLSKKASGKTKKSAKVTKKKSKKPVRKSGKKTVKKSAKSKSRKQSSKKPVVVPSRRESNSVKKAEVMPLPPDHEKEKENKGQTVNIQLNLKQ